MERSRLFVGRQEEMSQVSGWLRTAGAPTEVAFVSGMGGIGKSALLLKFLDMGQNAGARCLWLDGRSCKESPNGFLEAVHSLLAPLTSSQTALKFTIESILAAFAGRKTLLCIDNYEYLNIIQGWLREVFLPELPVSDVLVVLAGRQQLSLDWQNDLAWRGRLRHMPLEPFTNREARSYYANVGLDNRAEIDAWIRSTHGHPLAIALVADNVNRDQRASKSSADWPVSHVVSAQLLREVVTPDLHEILDLLSILPQANQELLNRLLPSPLTLDQLHRLTQLSFVRPTTEGFALHDVARAHLLEDFIRREPQRFRAFRRRIVEDACGALREADPQEKNAIAASLLSICRDALPQGVFSLHPVGAAFDMYREGDLPHLHKLVDEQKEQLAISLESEAKVHRLLDDLAGQFPESIRLLRSEKGIPIMFHAGLLLYLDTYGFLQHYIPGVLAACFPAEARRLSHLRHEEADTYYHFLGGVDHHDPEHLVPELYESMFTDGFSRLLNMGTRVTVTPKGDVLRNRFAALGFQVRKLENLPPAHPAHGDFVYDLDLRTRDFGEWVSSFLEQPVGDTDGVKDPGYGNGSRKPRPDAEELKAAFAVLEDAALLGRTALARRAGCSGIVLQTGLRRLLASDPPPSPLSRRNQVLLKLLLSDPTLNPDAAASRLHISRATYYRHLREAVDRTMVILGRQRR